MRGVAMFLFVVALGVPAWGMSFWGDWDFTLQLLPTVKIYGSELTLDYSFAPGWRIESESEFSDVGLKYQNFYLDGWFGDFDVWGKIYFHAADVRYRKMWVNAEIPVGEGDFRISFNHWASGSDYSDDDEDKFGPWPCVEVVSWSDAWRFMGREVYVSGPVASYGYSAGGPLYLNIGEAYPSPDRFQIYIAAAYVDDFEAVLGGNFWETWVGKVVCVRGKVKGYRYTSGGPGGGGYSVAEVSITSPGSLSLGTCPGLMVSPKCPGTTIRWFEAKNYVGQTVYVQGPVGSVGLITSGPYAGQYRVRIGGGTSAMNRVVVIMPNDPGWSTASTSYTNEVCVYGKISLGVDPGTTHTVAIILPSDLISSSGSPCCSGGLPGMFLNWRYTFTWDPFTLTVDLSDCCQGTWFRQLSLKAADVPLCCGLSLDSELSFSKEAGLEKLSLTMENVPLGCCGITAKISVELTPTGKAVEFEPEWKGISGCLTVYGDVHWADGVIGGLEVYGFGVSCYVGELKLRAITALNPDAVEDLTDISFYRGEWEYLGLTYTAEGCCDGDLEFKTQIWFGTEGMLFDLQRLRFDLTVPLTDQVSVFTKGQWNFAKVLPLEWLDIGWSVSF